MPSASADSLGPTMPQEAFCRVGAAVEAKKTDPEAAVLGCFMIDNRVFA